MEQGRQTALRERPGTGQIQVNFADGEAYEITVRGHRLLVDQPVPDGGLDCAPSPTELFVGSLASCVAFYAGRYLTRHGYGRDGLAVSATFEMAGDRPARVGSIRLTVRVPAGLPDARRPALTAVISHCTVHNSLSAPPDVLIDLR